MALTTFADQWDMLPGTLPLPVVPPVVGASGAGGGLTDALQATPLVPEDLLEEVQDLLLGQGDALAIGTAMPLLRKALARRCPVLTLAQMTQTTWVFGTYVAPHTDVDEHTGTYTAATAAVQDPAALPLVPLATTRVGDGHMIGGQGYFEEVTYTLQVPGTIQGTWQWGYWDGSTWRALELLAPAFETVALTHTVRFVPPEDWHKGAPTDVVFTTDESSPHQFWIRGNTTVAPAEVPEVTAVQVQTASYPLPRGVIDLLAVHWTPHELEPASLREGLDLGNPFWEHEEALVPVRYTYDQASRTRLRVAPRPQTRGGPPMPWLPGFFPDDNLLVCASIDDWDVPGTPLWAEGILTYLVAAHEARRMGETRNLFVAEALEQLSTGLIALLHGLWRDDGIELPQPWQSPLQKRVPA